MVAPTGLHLVLGESGEFLAGSVHSEVTFKHWWVAPETMEREADARGRRRSVCFDQRATEGCGHSPLLKALKLLDRAREPLELEEAFAGMLDRLLGDYVGTGRSPGDAIAHRGVRRMRDLIHDAYDRDLSLDLISEHAGLNKFYALRAFKRALGVTPHCYQRHLRVARARQMLLAGTRGTDVAQAVGFCDQSHFVRAFRDATLVTPGFYQTAG